MTKDLPEKYKDMVIVDAENVEEVASQVDFCFCAVNMKKDEIKALEERYAKAECPIVLITRHTDLLRMFLWLFRRLMQIISKLLTSREKTRHKERLYCR